MAAGATRIRNVTLFPGVRDGRALPIVPQGAVLIEDGRFVYAGAEASAPDAKVASDIDGQGMLLMPALVNAHTHSAMTLFRGAGADLPLKQWLYDVIFPLEAKLTPEMARVGVQLSMLEYLRCGVTTVNEMYFYPRDFARLAGEAGMRALVCDACVDFGDPQGQLDNALGFFREFHGEFGGRVRASVSVHAEYTSTPELVRRVVDSSRGLDNVVHTHLCETAGEVRDCLKRHGVTPVRYFHDLELFGMPTVAAHGVHVSDEDLDILASDGVTVALSPYSNLKLAAGIAPAARMLERGVKVAIGTDSAASNDSLDLFGEMKLTGTLHKGTTGDPAAFPPTAVLEAATVSGARAMGFQQVGLIREGWEADCVLLDMSAPNILPNRDVPSALVYAARGDNVRMTMARGRVLYRDGEYMTVDRERVLREAAALALG
ncbi:MAG TPA: amidohydrolase [Candidatus Limnocylindria bacterium]|nr:amidohydrolase [Candidatus Limnocylindria bacterium]